MTNLYFLEGDNHLLLSSEIDNILKENNLSRNILVTMDMGEENISKAILYLDTYGFFSETKVLYCRNATFLEASSSCEINHDIEAFIKYIENPNKDNILIISCSKGDGKKKVVKLLKEKAKYISVSCDLNDYVKSKCTGYKISSDTIKYLLETTGSDIDRVTNELNKILSYKIDSKEITTKDIDLIVIKKIDNNIFDLIDAIINKNKEKSLTIYENMINYGEDIIKIFIALANQIRLIYQVKVLRNLSNDEIADILKVKNPKQIVALRYKIDKYKASDLLNYLYKLSIMDEEIKSGKSIDKIAFPMFIASL